MKTRNTNTKGFPILKDGRFLVFCISVIIQIISSYPSLKATTKDIKSIINHSAVYSLNKKDSCTKNSIIHTEKIIIVGEANIINQDKKTNLIFHKYNQHILTKQKTNLGILKKAPKAKIKTIVIGNKTNASYVKTNNNEKINLLLIKSITSFISNFNNPIKIWNPISYFSINNINLISILFISLLMTGILSSFVIIFRNRPPPFFV